MNKGVLYFIIMIVVFGGFALYTKILDDSKPALLTEQAVEPDLLLDNSKFYLKEHAYERSLDQLDQAIKAIREIELDLDEESKRILEFSISELELVRTEMEMDSLVTEDLNEAFSDALNALTIAELKISEILLQQNHPKDALVALKYGMYHVKHALKYSQGEKKEYEIHIYEEIDELLENNSLSEAEMIEKLEAMIHELDILVEGEKAAEGH
ncbi:MAG: hypothetical protein R8G66_11850 [Cytophagales bacterium]|nr:hypothetical protein [Cytophagales bacterium]